MMQSVKRAGILCNRVAALNSTKFMKMNVNQIRMYSMLTQSKFVNNQVMGLNNMRAFSAEEGSQTLNDNEIIELVEGKVFEILKSAAKCDHSKLSRTATFEELGFDSLDGVELVLAMEEHFGFDISNEDAEKITAVMDAIQIFHSYVKQRLAVE